MVELSPSPLESHKKFSHFDGAGEAGMSSGASALTGLKDTTPGCKYYLCCWPQKFEQVMQSLVSWVFTFVKQLTELSGRLNKGG